MSKVSQIANDTDSVLRFLDNHKSQAVTRLFHTATAGYRSEWLARDVLAFWYHLDIANRNALVRMAIAHYSTD